MGKGQKTPLYFAFSIIFRVTLTDSVDRIGRKIKINRVKQKMRIWQNTDNNQG